MDTNEKEKPAGKDVKLSDKNDNCCNDEPNQAMLFSDISSPAKKIIALDILILIIIALIRAVSTQVFIIPNKFAPGGVTGIASIIYNTVAMYNPTLADNVFNPAIVMFILHIPLVVVAYFKINKKFALRSALTLVMISVFLYVIQILKIPSFRAPEYDSYTKILAAVAGGVLSGFCIGSLLKRNCSTGGTDLLGRLLQLRKPHYSVVWLIFICDVIVVMLSSVVGILSIPDGATADAVLVWILTPMLYSGITLFISSKVADIIIKGYDSAVVFQIITNRADVVGEAIKQNLKKTATILIGKGVYTQTNRDIIVFVVKKHCILEVKRLIHSIDPKSFTYITSANEVYGVGFKGY